MWGVTWYCTSAWIAYNISKLFPNCFQAKVACLRGSNPVFSTNFFLFILWSGSSEVLNKLDPNWTLSMGLCVWCRLVDSCFRWMAVIFGCGFWPWMFTFVFWDGSSVGKTWKQKRPDLRTKMHALHRHLETKTEFSIDCRMICDGQVSYERLVCMNDDAWNLLQIKKVHFFNHTVVILTILTLK